MPRVEFGHLYKFLVSSGIALLFTGIALPWFVLQLGDTVQLTSTEVSDLAPESLAIFSARASHIAWMQSWYPAISVAFFAAGLTIAIYGLVRWRERQSVVDHLENIQRDTALYTYELMSETDIEAKRTEDAAAGYAFEQGNSSRATLLEPVPEWGHGREAPRLAESKSDTERVLSGEPNLKLPLGPEAALNPDRELSSATEVNVEELAKNLPQSKPEALDSIDTRKSLLAGVQKQVTDLLQYGYFLTHRVETNVRVGQSPQSVSVDALLVPREKEFTAVAIEVHYVDSNRVSLSSKLLRIVPLAQMVIASLASGPTICAVQVFVWGETPTGRALGDLDDALGRYAPSFKLSLGIVVVTRADLDQISPRSLREGISTSLRERRVVRVANP